MASGVKYQNVYGGDMLYEDSTLTRIDFEGGYLSFSDDRGNALARPEYHFYVCDHLGNNRMDLTDGGAITEIVDYYPFGLPMGCSYHPAAQRRLFGGKELDRTAGLNLYDQEARLYDPATGRFTRPDPLSRDYTAVSHYSFCLNNPLILTDPSGRKIDLSGMNEEQLAKFEEALNSSKSSKLFVIVWSFLESSEEVYSFSFKTLSNSDKVKGDGETKKNAFGCDVNLNDYGKTDLSDRLLKEAFMEECFHAYQAQVEDLGIDADFNNDFEAKTFVSLCVAESMGSAPQGSVFFNEVAGLKYGDALSINMDSFVNDYIVHANQFSNTFSRENEKLKDQGLPTYSRHYTAPTKRPPLTLLYIMNKLTKAEE